PLLRPESTAPRIDARPHHRRGPENPDLRRLDPHRGSPHPRWVHGREPAARLVHRPRPTEPDAVLGERRQSRLESTHGEDAEADFRGMADAEWAAVILGFIAAGFIGQRVGIWASVLWECCYRRPGRLPPPAIPQPQADS